MVWWKMGWHRAKRGQCGWMGGGAGNRLWRRAGMFSSPVCYTHRQLCHCQHDQQGRGICLPPSYFSPSPSAPRVTTLFILLLIVFITHFLSRLLSSEPVEAATVDYFPECFIPIVRTCKCHSPIELQSGSDKGSNP